MNDFADYVVVALAIVGATITVFCWLHFQHRDELTAEQKLRIECTQHAETEEAFERCMHYRSD